MNLYKLNTREFEFLLQQQSDADRKWKWKEFVQRYELAVISGEPSLYQELQAIELFGEPGEFLLSFRDTAKMAPNYFILVASGIFEVADYLSRCGSKADHVFWEHDYAGSNPVT